MCACVFTCVRVPVWGCVLMHVEGRGRPQVSSSGVHLWDQDLYRLFSPIKLALLAGKSQQFSCFHFPEARLQVHAILAFCVDLETQIQVSKIARQALLSSLTVTLFWNYENINWAQKWVNNYTLFGELGSSRNSKAGARRAKPRVTFSIGMEECYQRLDFGTTVKSPSSLTRMEPFKHQ